MIRYLRSHHQFDDAVIYHDQVVFIFATVR